MKVYRAEVEFVLNRTNMAGFLDMMRYDAAQVQDWSAWTDYTYSPGTNEKVRVVLYKMGRPFTKDRWASFGLIIKERA